MKTRAMRIAIVVSSLLGFGHELPAQPAFQNLDFEAAQLVSTTGRPSFVDFAAAAPGWAGHLDGVLQTSIWSNNLPVGSGGYFTMDAPPWTVPQGQYAISFGSGFGANTNETATLSQTGQVPIGSKSLTFLVSVFKPDLSLGGQDLPLADLGYGPAGSSVLWGADVSAFAGQTVELRFSVGAVFLDDIRFSESPIPEPCTRVLAGLGILALLVVRRGRLRSGSRCPSGAPRKGKGVSQWFCHIARRRAFCSADCSRPCQ